MKKIKLLLCSISLVSFLTPAVAQDAADPAALGDVIGITDVIVSDAPSYVAALKTNSQAFRTLGSNLAGFCQAVSGGAPGEALVFSYADNMAASLASVETQLTNASFQNFVATLEPYRELAGSRQSRVLRPYSGQPVQSWAMRNVLVNTSSPEAYMAAVANLEQAARANGFSDLSLMIQQEMGSGSTSDLLVVAAIAPTLARLGAALDAIYEEQWAQSVFATVAAARSQIVDDKIYRCEQVYVPM